MNATESRIIRILMYLFRTSAYQSVTSYIPLHLKTKSSVCSIFYAQSQVWNNNNDSKNIIDNDDYDSYSNKNDDDASNV